MRSGEFVILYDITSDLIPLHRLKLIIEGWTLNMEKSYGTVERINPFGR